MTVKLKYRAQAKKPTSASKTISYSHTLLKQQILYRKKTAYSVSKVKIKLSYKL